MLSWALAVRVTLNINFIQSDNRSGQVGGLIHNSLPAAFSSALSLALTTQLTEIPCTEDLLFQLIRDRTKEKNEIKKSEERAETKNTEETGASE